jgi:hypothetical protein
MEQAKSVKGDVMDNQGVPEAGPRTAGVAISELNVPAVAIFAGFIVCLVGSVAPWVTRPIGSVSGTSGGGLDTIALAGAGLVVLVLLLRGAKGLWLTLAGIAVALIGLGQYEVIHLHAKLLRATVLSSQVGHVGWGAYAVIAGGALAFLGCWWCSPPSGSRRASVRR